VPSNSKALPQGVELVRRCPPAGDGRWLVWCFPLFESFVATGSKTWHELRIWGEMQRVGMTRLRQLVAWLELRGAIRSDLSAEPMVWRLCGRLELPPGRLRDEL